MRGTNGVVPAKTVKLICKTYGVKRDAIVAAVEVMAASSGQNGVKIIKGGKADEYPAELKLMAMGGARLYSKGGSGNRYVFDIVDKHRLNPRDIATAFVGYSRASDAALANESCLEIRMRFRELAMISGKRDYLRRGDSNSEDRI